MLKNLTVLGLIAFMTGCVTVKDNQVTNSTGNQAVIDGKLFTAVWMQKAAEYKALCIQAYNLAELRLEESLEKKQGGKPLAIVTDIDETFLDNSPYAVHQALQGKDYEPASWDDWVQKAAADTLAGAFHFFQFAAKNKVAVFYVTNRNTTGRKATLDNLRKYGFPDADEQHLMTSTGNSSKTERRQQIEKDYHVILLLGDNLADFAGIFDKNTVAERDRHVEEVANEFGKRFIVLPNPNYGDWESALYHYNHLLSAGQKDSTIRAAGKSY